MELNLQEDGETVERLGSHDCQAGKSGIRTAGRHASALQGFWVTVLRQNASFSWKPQVCPPGLRLMGRGPPTHGRQSPLLAGPAGWPLNTWSPATLGSVSDPVSDGPSLTAPCSGTQPLIGVPRPSWPGPCGTVHLWRCVCAERSLWLSGATPKPSRTGKQPDPAPKQKDLDNRIAQFNAANSLIKSVIFYNIYKTNLPFIDR